MKRFFRFFRRSQVEGVPVTLQIRDDGIPAIVWPDDADDAEMQYIQIWMAQTETQADLRALQRYAFMNNGKA